MGDPSTSKKSSGRKHVSVGPYRIFSILGRGGMGEVYLGERAEDGAPVAIKSARGDLGAKGLERLKREADLLARTKSPYLPGFVELLELETRSLLVMEFVEGRNLEKVIRDTDLPSDRIAVLQQAAPGLAGALRELHKAGIVHRDIKPANVLLADSGRSVLVDLGLARAEDVKTLTATGAVLGTPSYMTPEHITGRNLGESSDLYQVALIVHDILVDRDKIDGREGLKAAMRRTLKPWPDPRTQAPWIPDPIAEWLRDALHPDVNLRSQPKMALPRLVALTQDLRPDEFRNVDPDRTFGGQSAMGMLGVVDTLHKQAAAKNWTEPVDLPPELAPGSSPDLGASDDVAVVESEEAPAPTRPQRSASKSRKKPGRAASKPFPQPSPAPKGRFPVPLAVLLGAFLGAAFRHVLVRPPPPPPPPALSAQAPLVLTVEGSQLVAIAGVAPGRTLALAEPEARDFLPDAQGRLVAPLPAGLPEDRGLVLTVDGQPRVLPLPEVHRTGGLRILAGADGPTLEVPVLGAGEARAFASVVDAAGVGSVASGAGVARVPLPRQMGEGRVKVQVWTDPAVRFERSMDLRERAQQRARDLALPVLGYEATRDSWVRFNGGGLRGRDGIPAAGLAALRAHASELRGLLGFGLLPEAERYRLYQMLVPYRLIEWMWRRRAADVGQLAAHVLGPELAFGDRSSLAALAPDEQGTRFEYRADVRLGADNQWRDKGDSGGDVLTTRKEKDGVRVLEVPGLPVQRPRAVELGLLISGGDEFGALEVGLPGGRALVLPLDAKVDWRFHRVPADWLWDGVDSQGKLELRFRVAETKGLRLPTNLAISFVTFDLVQGRD